jgi:hypothetical protein
LNRLEAAEALAALKLQAFSGDAAVLDAALPIRRSSSNRNSLLGHRSSSSKSVVSFHSGTVGSASDWASSVCSDPVFASACIARKGGKPSLLLGNIQRTVLPILFSSRYLENITSNRSLCFS